MSNEKPLRVRDLQDVHGLVASVIVTEPVPTARTPADRVVEDDDVVFVDVVLPGGVKVDAALTGAEYRAMVRGVARDHAQAATRPLPLEG